MRRDKNKKNYNISFLEYLNNYRGKFVIMISRNQYAIDIDIDMSHEEMITDLIEKTREDVRMDLWGNPLDRENSYKKDTVFLIGYPGYMYIEFNDVDEFSPEQYDCLSEIFYYVKNYNDDCNANFRVPYEIHSSDLRRFGVENSYKVNLDVLLEVLRENVKDDLPRPDDEIIIGRKFDECLVIRY